MPVGRRPTKADIDGRAYQLYALWTQLCSQADQLASDVGKYSDGQISAGLGYTTGEAASLRAGVNAAKALCDVGRGSVNAATILAAQGADANLNPFGGV